MLVQQALVGSASGEEQLFSSESSLTRDGIACELDVYLEKIKVCNFLCSSVS
jgi:protein CLEC16A